MSTDVSEVRAASFIALMMEAARTSETSVDIQLRTRQYIPEDSELHAHRRENLKAHIFDITTQCLLKHQFYNNLLSERFCSKSKCVTEEQFQTTLNVKYLLN
jgi:hypothetical protein